MHPLANDLNTIIKNYSSNTFQLLSKLGQEYFFPKGIVSQGTEAKEFAHQCNATLGIATEHGTPMHLGVTKKYFNYLSPSEIYLYAPPAGRIKLRKLWQNKIYQDNPSLGGKLISLPITTNALTHGLSIAADLFVNPGDTIIIPDKMWENYHLIFSIRRQSKFKTFPFYNYEQKFNIIKLKETLDEIGQNNKKIILLLNFPNNPTGYTPSIQEASEIVSVIQQKAETHSILVICDDAYFGLFFENSMQESIFAQLSNLHHNVLTIKIDGATKENYVWGFRTGFITFGTKTKNPEELYQALEKKVMGVIRSTISNCPHVSQSIIEKILEDPNFTQEKQEKFQIMKERAKQLKQILQNPKYQKHWDYYPFNSGYFMCLKIKHCNAEQLRLHLLQKYGVGIISIDQTDLRIAFSCIEKEDIEELFEIIYQGCCDLS